MLGRLLFAVAASFGLLLTSGQPTRAAEAQSEVSDFDLPAQPLADSLRMLGEAGCMPPTYSLVGDYFPRAAERARAMAVYWLAGPLAALVSFMLGGWLNERVGWRATFFIMGAPALLVAFAVKLTLAEPRLLGEHSQRVERSQPRMSQVCRVLWRQRSSRHLSIGIILFFTMGLGLAPWYAAFMMRSHGMGTQELGIWLGLIFGISGIVGTLVGGELAARWFEDDERGQLRVRAMLVAGLVPCFVLFLLVPGKTAALLALIPLVAVGNIVLGPSFALMQRLVADDMRATTLAVIMLLANLIGMGLAPQFVGLVSDALAPSMGADSLRYAMLGISLVALAAAYHFWRAGRTVRADLSRFAAVGVPAHPAAAARPPIASSISSS